MNTIRTGSTEQIQIYATLASGSPATGLTDLYVRVRRSSDGFYLDWNDMTFKSSGWTTLNQLLTELDATNAAGLYSVALNTGAITNPSTDDVYTIIPLQTPGTTARLPQPGELQVGRWVDQMNSMFGKLPTNYIMGSSTQADKDGAIDDILTDTADMQPRVVAIEADTNEMQGKLPTNNIMGSSVKDDKDDEIDAILTDTADMQPRVVAIEADTNEIQGKLPDNYIMGSGVTTDKDDEIDAIKTNTETIITDVGNVVNDVWDEQASLHTIGGSMGFNQNRLDADISTRESEAQAASRALTNQNEHDATQAAIAALENASAADIADAVWDEPLADHLGAGSTGQALSNADAPTLAQIVDGVWDETMTSHTTPDSAAVELKSKAEPGAAMDLIADALDATSLAASAVGEIADGVWDEPLAGHLGAGSAGQAQDHLDVDVSTRAAPGAAMDLVANAVDASALDGSAVAEIADGVWDEPLAGHVGAGSTGEAQNRLDVDVSSRAEPGDQMALTGVERAQVVDDVWDELQADHLTAGTTGKSLDDAKAVGDPNAIASAVWSDAAATGGVGTMGELQRRLDANVSSRAAPGAAMDLVTDAVDANALATSARDEIRDSILSDSTPFQGARIDAAISSRAQPGDAMDLVTDAVDSNALAASAVNDIADQVWEEAIADHSGTVGSTAEQLAAAGAGATPGAIADAVWDEALSGHTGAGTTGEAQNRLDDIETDTNAIDSRLPTDPADESNQNAQHATTQAAIASLNDITANDVRDAILADSTPFNGADVAAILADTDAIDTRLPTDPADESNQLAAHATTQAAVASVQSAVVNVPDAVWDEPLAGHLGAGSTGKALQDAGATADPGAIADAVWDEDITTHTAADSAGEAQNRLDVDVSSRESEASAAARAATNQTEHDTTQAAIAGLPTPPSVGAIADAVWDETAADHTTAGTTGQLLNACGGAYVGAHQIEVNVEDQDTNPLQGVQVDIFDAGNTVFLMRLWTDVTGKVNVALDAGTYNVRLFATGYTFTVPEPLVVSADGSVTFTGTNQVNWPTSPDLCKIFGTVRNAGGSPIPGACVRAWSATPQSVGQNQQSEELAKTWTDANGYFEIELMRLALVNFQIEGTDVDVTKTVPDQPTQDVTTWT